MKILLTNNHLRDKAGSEIFTKILAAELKKRGNDVFVFSFVLGEVSEEIKKEDIKVSDNILDFKNENFDIIHVHHNTTALLVRSVFTETPIVFMSHGVLPELEQPPTIDLGISKYLAVSEEVRDNLLKSGVDRDSIELVRNFVDINKFKIISEPNDKLKNIMVLSNHYSEEIQKNLELVSKKLNLEIIHVGLPENPVVDVENYINKADLIITLGRGALESMSCGRNVLVYDIHGADGLVDEDSFYEIRKNNFSGRRFSEKYTALRLEEELLKYKKETGLRLRELVKKENSIDVVMDNLLRIYSECLGLKKKESKIKKGELFNEVNFFGLIYKNLQESFSFARKQNIEIEERDLLIKKIKEKMETEINKIKEENYNLIKEKDQELLSLKNEISIRDAQIGALLNSTSWKITKPVRVIKDKILKILHLLKKSFFVLREDGVFVLIKKIVLFLQNRYFGFFYSVYLKTLFILQKKNKKNDLITVITPIYNRTWELKESIESILNQTYQNFELILVTDGSPKETIDIVEGYRKNPKVRIFHFYNNTGNAVRGRNKAIKESRGKYIAFQDSDDIADRDRLKKSISFIKKHNVDMVYGGWRAILDGTRTDTGLSNGQEVRILPDYDIESLQETSISPNSVMVKKNAIVEVGGFKPVMEYREDHELWLRLAYFGYKLKSIPSVLTTLRFHKGNNELCFKKDDKHWMTLMYKEYKKKGTIPLKIGYVIPGVGISGGVSVILYHLNGLLKKGYDVFIISADNKDSIDWFPDQKVPIIPLSDLYLKDRNYVFENIDILVATHWSTFEKVLKIKSKRKMYFIQSDERDFEKGDDYRAAVEKTYRYKGKENVEFFTMAKWIKKLMKEEFSRDCRYVPNGLDSNIFHETKPLEERTGSRVLLEGPISIPFKGMKNAFEVVRDLDCEVWAVSSSGYPEKEWRCDRFFEKVKLFDMPKIYSSCDILLKMSEVESFAYPPLEMMACGGVPVIKKVPGIEEYAQDGVNCFIVNNNQEAKVAVRKLLEDPILYKKMKDNAVETSKRFNWEKTIEDIEEIFKNPLD